VSKTAIDIVIDDYLQRLDRALSPLPDLRREQLVAEISDHVIAARDELDQPSEADIRNLLDRIGRPEDIAAEAIDSEPPPTTSRGSGLHESFAIALLLVGGFVFVVGWFVGLVLLWTSSAWRVRDKLIGTFLLPGGLFSAFFLLVGGFGAVASTTSCSTSTANTAGGGPSLLPATCRTVTHGNVLPLAVGISLLAAGIIVPIITAVYLNRRRHTSLQHTTSH
jgi:hypothetical protein